LVRLGKGKLVQAAILHRQTQEDSMAPCAKAWSCWIWSPDRVSPAVSAARPAAGGDGGPGTPRAGGAGRPRRTWSMCVNGRHLRQHLLAVDPDVFRVAMPGQW